MAVAKKEGSLSKKEERKNETYSARRRGELHVNIFFFFFGCHSAYIHNEHERTSSIDFAFTNESNK